MGFVKLCCAAAVASLAQARAESSVFVRDSSLLTSEGAPDAALSEQDFSFLAARLAGSASPLESKPPSGLPVTDLFHEAAGSVVLVVTGADAPESMPNASTQFSLEDTSSDTDTALTSLLTGNAAKPTIEFGKCASLDSISVCSEGAVAVAWEEKLGAFVAQTEGDMVQKFGAAVSAASPLLASIGVTVDSAASATHTATGASFDLTDATTMQMFAELELFHQLALTSGDSLPRNVILSAQGVQRYTETHGSSDAVNEIVADAASEILNAWDAAYGDDASFGVAVFRHNANAGAAGARRMLATSSNSSTTDLYTQAQINEYQLFTWTWFLLILIVFFAACSLGGVDIGRDDAGLYSNFKASSYDMASHDHYE